MGIDTCTRAKTQEGSVKFVICLSLLSPLLCVSAQARDIEVGTVLTCDTQRQAERVGTLLHGDAQNVANAVNEVNAEEHSRTACGVVNAAYVRGTDLATVRAKGETFQIAPILLIGLVEGTDMQSVPQKVSFAVFKIDERMA
jgi:hypothetical protein